MKKGIYKHYKGGEVEVLGVAIADWDNLPQVIYKDLDTHITKVQALQRFTANAIVAISPVKKEPRFTFVREIENGK